MASAISTLYGMGYTLAEDESSLGETMDEDRGSDKSSPDIHRHRQVTGFDGGHQLYSPGRALLPTPVPPASQYAAMLAGIGLNLTAVRSLLHKAVSAVVFYQHEMLQTLPLHSPGRAKNLLAMPLAHSPCIGHCRRTCSATSCDRQEEVWRPLYIAQCFWK